MCGILFGLPPDPFVVEALLAAGSGLIIFPEGIRIRAKWGLLPFQSNEWSTA